MRRAGARDARLGAVVIDFPPLVVGKRVNDGAAVVAAVDGHVMLVTLPANVLKKRLQRGDFHHPVTAEGLEPVGGDFALAAIGADLAGVVVGGDTAIRKRARLQAADHGSKAIGLPHRARDDFLEIHLGGFKKCLGRLEQWKMTALSGSSP